MSQNDGIEDLLRSTGRRPAVPVDRAVRVEAAVRAHWEAEVRRHVLRRRAWIAAALATAASLATVVGLGVWRRGAPAPVTDIAALVERVVDSAWSRSVTGGPEGSATTVRPGDRVATGSELATEAGGRLALRMATGHSVRLDGGTRVSVLSDRVITLERGAVYVDSHGPTGAAADFVEIRTPFGTLRDVGTQFEVRRLATSLRVRVREGSIALEAPGGPLEVSSGQELELGDDGRIARRATASSGADWTWIGDVTPMLELEGRSLQQFLDWIARERGLRLRFAGSEIATSAPAIVLNGSIDGMTLEQALESVLLTCRMSHRIEGNLLVIQPSKDSRATS